MKVLLSSVLIMSALLPSLGKDSALNLPLSDKNDGGVVFPTIGVKIESSEVVVASTLLEKTTFNDTKKSIEEEKEARALAHWHTPHYYPYPKPRYHRSKNYATNYYYGGTKGYEAKGFYGKGGGGGKGGNGGKGKGKGKGYSVSSPPRSKYSFSRISKGKGGADASLSSADGEHHDHMLCQDIVFEIAQKWGGNDIIEPDGTFADSVSDASVHSGQRWPFAGRVSDRPHSSSHRHKKKKTVGSNTELCTRINHGEMWHCRGTYQDLYGCKGQLTFTGAFSDDDLVGKYAIVGGTGDFHGAQGHIIDDFDYDTLYSIRQIYIQ